MANPLRALVIGGYGEFGRRLSELLLRDGHTVIVAGRQLDKAQQFCSQYGGEPVQLDIHRDLHKIDSLAVDVVIDAAGPFQSYGSDDGQRYRVALTALNSNAHYLDLSDDGHFTKGIESLDDLAKQKNKFALSGASSTPALSGSAVCAMRKHFSSLEKIETSILPGSRAPQGYSVMQAILAQVGNPVKFWRNNAWVNCSGWSEPAIKSIGHSINRKANLITAADVELFPHFFSARSVLFRAGLAVPIMHTSLQWLGSLRQRGWLPNLTKFIKPLHAMANIITPLGNDHGGMMVEVTGKPAQGTKDNNDALLKSKWTLNAGPRHGPYVPTIAVRALLQHINTIQPGARACIDELPLDYFIAAMHDINVTTDTHQETFKYLFQTILNENWRNLPECLRNTHTVVDRKILTGAAKVTRGKSPMSKAIARVFRFPAAADNIPIEVTKTRLGDSEIWDRNFGGQTFRSILSPTGSGNALTEYATVQEQFGLLKFTLQLPLIDGVMQFNVLSGSCLGIPIPSLLLPVSNAREFVQNDRMHFLVELIAPLKIGLIVRYEGSLA